MVVKVFEQARKAKNLEEIIIAIDSKETEEALKQFPVKTVMTATDHRSGSDRVAEVAQSLEAEVVVNIQGDEPGIDPDTIDALIDVFRDHGVQMATAVSTSLTGKDLMDENAVKVLLDRRSNAVNFFRTPKGSVWGGYYLHIGIYAYRKETLLQFAGLPSSQNEITFKLEQMRALDNGIPIKVVLTDKPLKGIDRMEDLETYMGAE